RLAQDFAIDDDDSIGTDGDQVGIARRNRGRFLARQPFRVSPRSLALAHRLIDVRRANLVGNADQIQELTPARRRGRQDDTNLAHRSSQSVTGPSFTSSTSIIAPNSPL